MRKWKPYLTQSIAITATANGSAANLECRNPPSERPTPLRSIQEEDGAALSPAPASSGEKDNSPPKRNGQKTREDDEEEEEDIDSLASIAGSESERCLLKSSASPVPT